MVELPVMFATDGDFVKLKVLAVLCPQVLAATTDNVPVENAAAKFTVTLVVP